MQDSISNRIKSQRKIIGITQQKLADQIGVSMMTIVRWENGTRTPNSALMPQLAKALNTSVEYLMGLNDASEQKEMNAQAMHNITETLADKNVDLDAPFASGMTRNELIIRDDNSNRTYYFPNDEEGRKLFLMVLGGGLKGVGLPLTLTQPSHQTNNGTNSSYHDSVVHNGDVLTGTQTSIAT